MKLNSIHFLFIGVCLKSETANYETSTNNQITRTKTQHS